MRKRAVAVIAAAALGGGGIAAGIAASAASAGTWSCKNNGGNTVQGQTKCNGEGLTQANPGGNAPPGQQP